jgi:hypothetical protein
MLKASGGGATTSVPTNFIRVRLNGANVQVQTTNNAGATYTTQVSVPAAFVAGNTLTAMALADGTVAVYKNGVLIPGAVVVIPTTGTGSWAQATGGGRIGMQLPSGARVDNFVGQTVL